MGEDVRVFAKFKFDERGRYSDVTCWTFATVSREKRRSVPCENKTGGLAKTRIEAYGKKCPVGVAGPVRALDRTLLFVYVSNDR